MAKFQIPPARYIDSDEELQKLCKRLENADIIGVDTESNSMHAYHERVCLIQISSRTRDFIIDPFTIKDMSPLRDIFENPDCEKVFHAAEYDLMCLRRDYDVQVANLFDTMIAARICGYKEFGLSSLLSLHLDVEVDKSHQRDDWGQRPLSKSSLRYAQLDSHFLPRLRDILYNELQANGHMPEAQDMFEFMLSQNRRHEGRSFDPAGFWKLGLPNRLTDGEMIMLRELYILREEIAMERNKPPFKVLSNRTLIDIVQNPPYNLDQLASFRSVSPAQVRRWGRQILAALRRARNNGHLPPPPENNQPPPDISDRYIALHTWRKERALQRGVESDVIIPKQTLWSLAYHAPATLAELQKIDGIGPWKLQAYGEEILSIIEQHDNGLNGSGKSSESEQ